MPGQTTRIVLIGFRCAGKSTLAARLSEALNWPVWSSDAAIEERSGCRIADYVAQYGWPAFRLLELQVIAESAPQQEVIIDCGGGVVEAPLNMEVLCRDALVIWVDAELQDIGRRMAGDTARPLLSADDLQEDIRLNYTRREPLYRRYGRLRLNSSQQSLDEMCREVAARLDRH